MNDLNHHWLRPGNLLHMSHAPSVDAERPPSASVPVGMLLHSLRSMSVSDNDSRSPHAPSSSHVEPATVPRALTLAERLKQLKEAKRTAKRARDAAPNDAEACARYKAAKREYKEAKTAANANKASEHLTRVPDMSDALHNRNRVDEQQQEQQVQQEQHGQHVQQEQQLQQCVQQARVFGSEQEYEPMSPRVAAAALASRKRRAYMLSPRAGIGVGHVVGVEIGNVVDGGVLDVSRESKRSKGGAKRRVRFSDDCASTATNSPLSLSILGKSRVSMNSGKSLSNSGKVVEMSPQKVTSLNSVLENTPIPRMPAPTNSGKKSKTQQHKEYASATTFHPEWYARREEWLSNYSNEGTIRKYRPYANKLIQYIQQRDQAHLHPGQSITRTLINDFQKLIKNKETPNNQTMILSAVSSFLKHLAEEDVTNKDRSKSIKIPAQPKPKKKKDLTMDQVKTIMNAADNNKAKALLAAAYFAGLRTKETVHLSARNCKVIDGNMTIKVTKESAKGKKARDVPIAKSGADLLKPFIEAAKARGGQQYLFPGRFKGTHIVEKTMWNYIKKPARAVGLEDVAAHHFRHAFASHAAQNHVDIGTIKDQMGHSSLETTSKYVHGKRDHASSVSASLDKAFTADGSEPPPPVQKATDVSKAAGTSTQELVQLVNMYKDGLLTKDEFIAAKKNLKLLQ